MRLPAALRRLLRRGESPRPGTPAPPARDNPYSRYFTADLTPEQIARRLRGQEPDDKPGR